MTDEQIKHLVQRFLMWRLPEDFRPDGGISATRPNYGPGVAWEPSGTNLLDARQAEAMVRHMLEGMLSPANLNDPDKQEALAGEGVEGLVERLEDTARKIVEGATIYSDHVHGILGEAADMLAALSRTPSSPQADEADVERLRHLSEIRHLVDAIEGESIPHCRRRYIVRIREALAGLSTMTTRPAGGEEVADRARKLLAAQFAKEYREDVPRMETVPLQAALRAIATALTKPAALPKEGEELEVAARFFGYASWQDARENGGTQGAKVCERLAALLVSRALSSLPVSGEVEKLREALRLAEEADNQRDHCEECNGEDLAELCPECFPSADAARLARWEVLGIRADAALAPPPQAQDPDLGKIERGHVCKHGIRWPHPCEPCDEAAWALTKAQEVDHG